MAENHFRSYFSAFQINTDLFFKYFFFTNVPEIYLRVSITWSTVKAMVCFTIERRKPFGIN